MSSAAPNRAPLSPAEFAAALGGVSRETLARLEAYAALLRQWSARINLVAKATLEDVWRRHFLDSAQLRPLVPEGAQSLVDLGGGAGRLDDADRAPRQSERRAGGHFVPDAGGAA